MIVFLKSVCLSYDLKGMEYNEGWLNCYIKFIVKILLIIIFLKINWLGNLKFVLKYFKVG